MSNILVQTEGLKKIYPGKIAALNGVSLAVAGGEFLCILGPSGSGKTTLLNLIAGLDRPTEGRVVMEGVDLARVRDLARLRAEKIGLVFQFHNLIPVLNAWENVQLPLYPLRVSYRERRERAAELLERVGLKERMFHRPPALSGGERQRVAIARALVNNPRLALCDEPTGTLDSQTEKEIIQLLMELNKGVGTTFIVVTHNSNVAGKADRIVRLVRGRVEEKKGEN